MLVYHLLSAENALSDIALKRLRISRYAELNDPFELFGATMADRAIRTGMRDWRKTVNERHGLLCFSKDWKNPVLWSHYASKHRGVCLAIEVADHLTSLVRYSPHRLEIRYADGDPAKGLDEQFMKELLTTKYDHWSYEEEVRVFLSLDPKDVENGSHFIPFSDTLQLRGVVLGPLCDLPVERVRSMVHKNYDEVSVIKARLAHKFFNVVGDEPSVREDMAFHTSRGTKPLWRVKERSATRSNVAVKLAV